MEMHVLGWDEVWENTRGERKIRRKLRWCLCGIVENSSEFCDSMCESTDAFGRGTNLVLTHIGLFVLIFICDIKGCFCSDI